MVSRLFHYLLDGLRSTRWPVLRSSGTHARFTHQATFPVYASSQLVSSNAREFQFNNPTVTCHTHMVHYTRYTVTAQSLRKFDLTWRLGQAMCYTV